LSPSNIVELRLIKLAVYSYSHVFLYSLFCLHLLAIIWAKITAKQVTFFTDKRKGHSFIDMNTDILRRSNPSERLRQANLDVTVQVGPFKSKRRKKQYLTLILSLIKPRDSNVPLRMATKSSVIELYSSVSSNIDTNLSDRIRPNLIDRTFQFDLTRPIMTQRNRPVKKRQYQKLSRWNLPNFYIALGCEVGRRRVNCSKYRVKIIGSPRLTLHTIRKNKKNKV